MWRELGIFTVPNEGMDFQCCVRRKEDYSSGGCSELKPSLSLSLCSASRDTQQKLAAIRVIGRISYVFKISLVVKFAP